MARRLLDAPGMHHLVARTPDRVLLFTEWNEGLALFASVVAAVPGLAALCVMPDHLHLLHPLDVRGTLADALAGWTRGWNRRRGVRGALFEAVPPAEPLVDADKRRRSFRYLYLNPCRAGLAPDPLAWPLSTYRDAVGLAAWPVRPAERDPHALHAYVSADPSVAVRGTELPVGLGRPPTLSELLAATSELTRTPYTAFQRRGAPRALLVRAAKVLSDERDSAIADFVGVDRSSVCRVPRTPDPAIRAIARVIGDPRFPGIPDGRVPFARRYRLSGR